MKQDKCGWGSSKQAMVAVRVERGRGYGSVPGLKDEELADPTELERQVVLDEWGPILAVPVQRSNSWLTPAIDEKGNYDWGAFGTRDFERLYGSFDKARYKIDKLQAELRDAVIRLETHAAKVPGKVIDQITAGLRRGTLDPDDLEDWNQYFFAIRYQRVRRIRGRIRSLRNSVYRGPVQAAASEG